ncbi:MAG: hypothetical protein KIT10_05705 [Flavobacteriales bacterium]|nr:hypothetical protein [Flavobacteriales bacterium]
MNTQHPTPNTQHPLVLGSCMVALLAAVVLVACRKDTIPSPISADAAMASSNVTTRVQAFIAQARGSDPNKMAAAMTADSAEWYVEAALNYSVAKAWLPCVDLLMDSTVVTVPRGPAGIAVAEVYEAFNALSVSLAEVNVDDAQHVAIVDVLAKSSENELRLEVRYLVGSGYGKTLNTTFGENDAWLWGGSGGCNCGPNQVYSDMCAHAHIQYRVNSAVAVSMGPEDYWTNVETWFITQYATDITTKNYHWSEFYNPNNTSGKSNQDYWTYICGGSSCSTCLLTDDMSYHTQGTYDALMWIKAEHCPSKTPYAATVGWESGGGDNWHICSFTYGIKQTGGGS